MIIGAGGHGKVVADIVREAGDTVLGFLDDHAPVGSALENYQVLGKTQDFTAFRDAEFIVAVGNGELRQRLVERLKGAKFYTAIHPKAIISSFGTCIEEGTVIMAAAVVNACAKIGAHSIINTAAVVEHDNRIGSYGHVAVGARLAGYVTLEDRVWIGIGAVVSNNVSICADCTVGAGAVVIKDIKEPGTYAGVPARKIK